MLTSWPRACRNISAAWLRISPISPQGLTDPLESLAIYTSLFNKLGFAGVACTAIAIAMLPLMNRLSASHSDVATNHDPLPAVRSEEFNLAPRGP